MIMPTFLHAESHGAYMSGDRSEPIHWTGAQRAVWRFSSVSDARKLDVIDNGSLALGVRAFVEVNGSRWIVTCPFPSCGSAQYASYIDRRFWCIDCNNDFVGGQWVVVEWPDNVREIEERLELRPQVARHWVAGETVQDLIRQDLEHYSQGQ